MHANDQELALTKAVVDAATADPDRAKSLIYKAIAVQRPAVVAYVKSVRRQKPDASPAEILTELEKRYVATVTTASTGVGASAAIPGVGIPLAIGLGVADLMFFYETSALFVLAATELRGIEVTDVERARPLVFGMLLGEKSQSKISALVLQASGAGSVDVARTAAKAVAKSTWGEVLTQQLPDSALAPLSTVIAREALMASGKIGSRAVGKALPFGVGAVMGGVGSFTFGRDVVKAARQALPELTDVFPEALARFEKLEAEDADPSRAVAAMKAAAGNVSDFGEDVWGKAMGAAAVFRSVDLDGDGVPDEARAWTATKSAASGAKGLASRGAGSVAGALRRDKKSEPAVDSAEASAIE